MKNLSAIGYRLSASSDRSSRARLGRVLREELQGIHLRLLLAQLLMAPLPPYAGSRLRTLALRLAGFEIGYGSLFWGMPTITGNAGLEHNLRIGRMCGFNLGCTFDLGDTISIGDGVSLGHQVLLMTTSHTIGDAALRAAEMTTAPVYIGDGAWLGARCMILPGISVGAGAVVAAGAVVSRDVAPHTLVAGVPARLVRGLGPSPP